LEVSHPARPGGKATRPDIDRRGGLPQQNAHLGTDLIVGRWMPIVMLMR